MLCSVLLPSIVFSQKKEYSYTPKPGEVLIDAKLIRAQFGYSQMMLSDADTFANRTVDAINLKDEFQLLSNLFGYYNRFVIYDALYTEMLFGKMRNEPIQHNKNDMESKYSFMFRWGYDFFAGYRNNKFGILGGVRPRFMYTSIGDLSMTGNSLGYFLYTMPYAIKGEYKLGFHNEFRMMFTAWNNFSSTTPNSGVRLEIPFIPSGRWWLFGEYETYKNHVDYVFGIPPNNARYNTLTIGVRVGSMY